MAPGDRRRRAARAGAAVGVVVGRRGRRLHAGRRHGAPRAPARLRRRPRARDRAGDGRGRARDGHRRERPGAVLGAAWRAGQLRHRHRRSSSSWSRCRGSSAVPCSSPATPSSPCCGRSARGRRPCRRRSTTSVALLRLPPVDDVPPPLRGTVSLALRFGFTGSAEDADGAARADARGRGAGARRGRPDVVRRGRPDPHGPAGADAGGHPRRAADRDARRPGRRAPGGGRSARSTSRWPWSSCG